jgi:predicted O-methyltransferase YrrM
VGESHRFTLEWFPPNQWQFERQLKNSAGKVRSILEIGCFEGQGTCWLLENVATAPNARITCVDPIEQPCFWSNIAASNGSPKVELKLGPSRDILPTLPRAAYDFIFVDGDHGVISVLEDAVLSFPLAKVGAIIAFDDYKWNDPKHNQNGVPKTSIDAFLSIYRSKIEVLTKNYQVWIRKIAD